MEIFHNIMLIIFVAFMFFLVRGFAIQQKEKNEDRKRKLDEKNSSINSNIE